MLTLYVDGNLGNQEVELSDGSTGQLSGVRISGSILGSNSMAVQWTFISTGRAHEGFVYSGAFSDGMIIESMSGKEQYQIKIKM
ncbi:hypothetical protein PL11_009655 [Lentilactobacillus curieae]|uniref:Uncharacterized protein n=1 Tax=Lentilactobacillus curieae TaxID=1138822 RepID=A0A1S6QKP8_9LACO|nr:hypothetical protein [Lentilactobacillus curieae]AQW22169.1 hypothetical protein PL11_009655 [Lentilactobacillus curieae]